ncbi:hypothetical protein [Candidatus Electrothrix sp.]|uniref:hypothetical protein n=1 Tax=Candidatus Electrothrix sp. TaxID=2170559 RepID=UPI004055E207
MQNLVAQMTRDEFVQLIETVVEKKLSEFMEKIMENELSPELAERLRRQKEQVASGERGHLFSQVVEQLDLA